MPTSLPEIPHVPSEIVAQIIALAQSDEAFLARLQADLRGTVANRFGVEPPAEAQLLERDGTIRLCLGETELARWHRDGELDDADLELAGGQGMVQNK